MTPRFQPKICGPLAGIEGRIPLISPSLRPLLGTKHSLSGNNHRKKEVAGRMDLIEKKSSLHVLLRKYKAAKLTFRFSCIILCLLNRCLASSSFESHCRWHTLHGNIFLPRCCCVTCLNQHTPIEKHFRHSIIGTLVWANLHLTKSNARAPNTAYKPGIVLLHQVCNDWQDIRTCT